MGKPNIQLFRFIAESFGISTFIETGTCHGETVERVQGIFKSIYTVELSPELFDKAQIKLDQTAKCYYGKSVTFLKDVLPQLGEQPLLYWLDAHFSGGPSAGSGEQCPLLDEIATVNERPGNSDYIIVDDAHCFFSPAPLVPPWDPRQWPNMSQIFEALSKKPRYTVILTSWMMTPDGPVMPEDVILSVPQHAENKLFDWLSHFELAGLPQ